MAPDPLKTQPRDPRWVMGGIAAVVLLVLLAVMFWPAGDDDRTGVATTDSSPRVERNAPADKPKTDLTTPTPTKPAQ